MNAKKLIFAQRKFFETGKTLDLDWREEQLKKLHSIIKEKEGAILAALKTDLNKSSFEGYLSEVMFVLDELNFTLKHFREWAKPKKVATPILYFIASSRIYSDPLGVVLVMGPWNYPFQLLLAPVVAAMAAGNCAILKPSELAPATSWVLAELFKEAFDPAYVTVAEGGIEVSTALLEEKFDHIFFTGGTAVGKVVMAAAARHLTPVTLELGGKSPCIVDVDTPIEMTARRITWGKFFNAGQTCVAPDYVLVPRQLKPKLVEQIQKSVGEFFGSDPALSPDYARIINERHFQRLESYLQDGKIVIGGQRQAETLHLAPTVLDQVGLNRPVMQEEIFGPILPIIEYQTLDEAIQFVKAKSKPLALYFFSTDSAKQERVLKELSFGGGCLNDTIIHLANPHLPFGGVGESGMGAYHGKYGFRTFSHRKSVTKRSFLFDVSLRYPPYLGKLKIIKRIHRT
jgi:aldehyde dehydrogenase (NAD+)